jgi:hypothetical protein
MDFLHKVHQLDMAESRKDISLKCCKKIESCEDRGEDDNTRHDCYMVKYDINKTQLWVDAYVFSLECPVLEASIENLLHNMSFHHLTYYCMTRTEVEKGKVNKMLYLIQGRLFLIAIRVFLIDFALMSSMS